MATYLDRSTYDIFHGNEMLSQLSDEFHSGLDAALPQAADREDRAAAVPPDLAAGVNPESTPPTEQPSPPPPAAPPAASSPPIPDGLTGDSPYTAPLVAPPAVAASAPPQQQPVAGNGQFSPYDATFAKYAGPLANNPEFMSIVAAGTLAESNWDTSNRTGDGGHSWGLFQMHDHGAGSGMGDARLNPDVASAVMVPKYAESYMAVKARNPNLSGPALAAAVAQGAERSADPTGAAYATAYTHLMGGNVPNVSTGGPTTSGRPEITSGSVSDFNTASTPRTADTGNPLESLAANFHKGLDDTLASAGKVKDQVGSSLADIASKFHKGLDDTIKSLSTDVGTNAIEQGREATDTTNTATNAANHLLTDPLPGTQNVLGAGTKQMQASAGISPYEPGAQDLSPTEQYAQARGIASGLSGIVQPEALGIEGAAKGLLPKVGEAADDLIHSKLPAQVNPNFASGGLVPNTVQAAAPAAAQSGPLADALEMFAKQDAKPPRPSLSEMATNTGNWIERQVADKYSDLNHLGPDVEQSVALYQGRGGAAVQRATEALAPALKEVGQDDLPYLNAYVKFQADLERADVKGDRLASAGGTGVADAQQGLQQIEQAVGPQRFAAIQKADAIRQDAMNTLLDDKVQSGLIDPQLADQLKTMYPHYNPVRVLEAAQDGSLGAVGKKLTQNSNLLKRLTDSGSAADTEQPVRSAIRALVEGDVAIRRNDAAKQIAQAVVDQGLGQKVANLKLTTGPDIATGEMATVAGHKVGDVPGTISYFDKGQRVLVSVPPQIESAVKGMDDTSMGILAKIGSALNAPLKAGATTLSPVFIPTNAVADAVSLFAREGVSGLKRLPASYLEAAREGPTFRSYIKAGGGMEGGYFTRDPTDLQKAIQQAGGVLIRTPYDWKKVLRTAALPVTAPVKAMQRVGSVVEMGPRIAAYSNHIAKGETAGQAALAGRRVTVDFARGGQGLKLANSWVAFLNARVQGALAVPRTLRDDPSSRWRFAAIGALGASTYAWNRQFPEEYADIPNTIKDQYAVVILGHGEKDPSGVGFKSIPYVAIPLREWSVASSSLQHAFANIDGTDKRSWPEFLGSAQGAVDPISGDSAAARVGGTIPAPLRTPIESAVNQKFFSGTPIVSRKFEGTPPTAQFDQNTTPAAKAIGQATGNSPKMLDFGIQENTGSLGRLLSGDVNLLRGMAKTQGGQLSQDQYDQLDSKVAALQERVAQAVRATPDYQKATPDRQRELLKTANTELVSQVKQQIGIPGSVNDYGLPNKYIGVTDRREEQSIDQALSKVRAWQADPRNATRPSVEDQVLARRYDGRTNPAYTRAEKALGVTNTKERALVSPFVGAPVPAR